MKILIVATRAGKLAIAQTELVCSLLKEIHPDIKVKIKKIATEGDRDRRTAPVSYTHLTLPTTPYV